MDEFGIDLDRVLDEFEEREEGLVSVADGFQSGMLPRELTNTDVDESRSLPNFPAFEGLDLDLAEADFAPSRWNYEISTQENGRNDLKAVSSTVDNGTLPDVEPLRNENDLAGEGAETLQATNQTVTSEVDVLSACLHTRGADPDVPGMQEHLENRVHPKDVVTSPPDIVCSAPDVVSSAMVGVDVVPSSRMSSDALAKLNLNPERKDLQEEALVAQSAYGDCEVPILESLDVILQKDKTVSEVLECTDLQEEDKIEWDNQLSDEALAEDLKMRSLEGTHVEETCRSPIAPTEISHFYEDEPRHLGIDLDGATDLDAAAECFDAENSNIEEIAESSINVDKNSPGIALCPLQENDKLNDIAKNVTSAFSPFPPLTSPCDSNDEFSSEEVHSKGPTLVLHNEVHEGSNSFKVLDEKHESTDGIKETHVANNLEGSEFEAQPENEEICSAETVVSYPGKSNSLENLVDESQNSVSSDSCKFKHENLEKELVSCESEDLKEISEKQDDNEVISESECHSGISQKRDEFDVTSNAELSDKMDIRDPSPVQQTEVIKISAEDEKPFEKLPEDEEKFVTEENIETETFLADETETELRNDTESYREDRSKTSKNTEELNKQNDDMLESATNLSSGVVDQDITTKESSEPFAQKQTSFVGFGGAEFEKDFTEEEISTYLRELDMNLPDGKAIEANYTTTHQNPEGDHVTTRFKEEFSSAENVKFPLEKYDRLENEEEESKPSNLVYTAVVLDRTSEDKKTSFSDELNPMDMLSSQSDSFMLVNGHGSEIDEGNDSCESSGLPVQFGNLGDDQVESLMKEVEEEVRQMILDVGSAADRDGDHTHSFSTDVGEADAVEIDIYADRGRGESFEDQAMFVVYGSEAKDGKILEDTSNSKAKQLHYVPDTLEALQTEVVQSQTAMEMGLEENSCDQHSFSTEDVATTSDQNLSLPVVRGLDHHGAASSNVSSNTGKDCPSLADALETRQPENVSGARRKEIKAVKPDSLDLTSSLQQPSATLASATSEDYQVAAEPSDAQSITAFNPAPGVVSPPSVVSTPTIPLCSNIGLEITQLGKVAPVWLPDAEASKCMECEVPFSFTRRRHHCRACGKVFCHGCSSLRATLQYLENRQDRVCSKCYQDLVRVPAQASSDPQQPHQQFQTSVSAPTGVLRKQGSIKGEAKQVMFSDGIRPGGDLTELDGSSDVRPSTRRSRKADKSSPTTSVAQIKNVPERPEAKRTSCLIPNSGLPPVVISSATKDLTLKDDIPAETIIQRIKDEQDLSPVMFAINRDVVVLVKIINLDCCVNRLCWCFTTKGLCTVGQDEIVIILECMPDEKTVPVDILHHLHVVYEMASHGNTVNNLDHTVLPSGSLGSQEVGGFLYIRQTFQCLQKIILPDPPYLFGLLLQKWEMSWARVFPLRLMFRLGAEFRYYPSPLISIRSRKPVYGEIGHTIMNLLADFHNYQYMIPRINGLVIHMEDKRTTVSIPRNRYNMLMKILSNSDDHVIALGASFSSAADSHLVCLQNEDGNYQTQAINIQNRPRKVTGACFIVFNGALKPTSGLRAKSSIVEDGLMVQITSDAMTELKQVLSEMKDYKILCGSVEIAQPDEMVIIEWNNDEKHINAGVKSPIDGLSMYGIDSIRIHSSTDFAKDELTIRWTEVFVLRNGAGQGASSEAPSEVSHLAESLAQACCQALVGHLSRLAFEMLNKIALRVTIDTEQVGYEIGARGVRLPDFCMNDLDEKLIGIIHGAASQARSGPIVLELIFHILHPHIAKSGQNTTALAK